MRLVSSDPDVVVQLPPGWKHEPLAGLASLLEQQEQQVPASFRPVVRDLIRRVRRGIVVGQAAGPVDASNYTPSVSLSVEHGDTSLASAAARIIRHERALGRYHQSWRLVDRRTVALPVGPAVRFVSQERPPAGLHGVPSHSVEYVLFLDGGTVSLGGTSPTADHAFLHTVDFIARSIVRS